MYMKKLRFLALQLNADNKLSILTKRLKTSWYFTLSLKKDNGNLYDINRFQTDYHVHMSGKLKIKKKNVFRDLIFDALALIIFLF
jgi:hypothetical protein